jgi:hypothetical protein
MDSRMIDVAIGVVLVFALSGLAVTTLHEIWVTLGKSRGTNLERAIHTMLGDDKGGFAGEILVHPLIASLTDKPLMGRGKPSYIGADVFVTALVSQLSRVYCASVRPATPAELMAAVNGDRGKVAGQEPTEALVKVMNTLLDGTDTDWATYLKRLCAWYDDVGERSIGWFRRATQMRLFVLGFLLAMVVNINPFVIAPRLWNDKALRESTVQLAKNAHAAFASAGGASAPDSTDTLVRVLAAVRPPEARNQAQAPTAGHPAIEAEVDARLAAFVRSAVMLTNAQGEQANVALLSDLQLVLDLLPELERFVKLRRTLALSGDTQGVQDAGDSITRRLEQIGQVLGKESEATESAGKPPKSKRVGLARLPGATKDALWTGHADLMAAVKTETKRLRREQPKSGRGLCPDDDDPALKRMCEQWSGLTDSLVPSGLPIGWTAMNLPDCAQGPCAWELMHQRRQEASGPSPATPAAAASAPPLLRGDETTGAIRLCGRDLNCAGVSLLGWSITALAAMLGAPFWFDMLGKLIKVRGSGSRPSDETDAGDANKSGRGGAEPASLLSTPPSTSAEAVPAAMRDVQTSAEAKLRADRVRELQVSSELRNFGAQPTGFFDEDMRKAIMAWQSNRGESVTGELTQTQIEQLLMQRSGDVGMPVSSVVSGEDHVDGCDAEIGPPTDDAELPEARGGVGDTSKEG